MTDHTSDDLLKQPEPSNLVDDPQVDQEARQSLTEYFTAQAEITPSTDAPAPAQPRADAEKITDFVSGATPDPNPLETELQQVKRELALLKLTPQERYPEVLKDAEITTEHAHQILDCVIVQLKPWMEDVQVTKKLRIRLQTRGQQDQRRLDAWAEKTRPQLDTTVVAEALINNMAASLVAYGDRTFYGDDTTDEETRYDNAYEFLSKMPYPAFRLVQTALAKFDKKINAVFSEGYLENF